MDKKLDKKFIKLIFALALPIALQNMTTALLPIIDMMFIEKLGDIVVSSVSLANQLTYVESLIVFGLCAGASTFISQCYGDGNYKKMNNIIKIVTFLLFVITFILFLWSLIMPKSIMKIYTNNYEIIDMGSTYLRIIAPTFILIGFSTLFTAIFRSLQKPKQTFISGIITLVSKIIFNIIFVSGILNFTSLGIKGAAVATLLCRVMEFLYYLIVALMDCDIRKMIEAKSKVVIKDIKEYFIVSYSIILNETFAGVGSSVLSAAYGRMGATTVVAMNICFNLQEVFNSFIYGIGGAALAVLGSNLGTGDYKKAEENAKKFNLVGWIVGFLCLLIMVLINIPFVNIFFKNISEESRNLTNTVIFITALYMPFTSSACVKDIGILRSGGDTFYPMLSTILPTFVVSVPFAFILGVYFTMPISYVIIFVNLRLVLRYIMNRKREKKKIWIKKII